MSRWNCALFLLLLLAPAIASGAGACTPITPERKAELCRYVERKYRLPEDVHPVVAEAAELGGGCYRKLRFLVPGKRKFEVSLILTPDQKYLVSELNDISVDPIAEEKRRAFETRRELEKDDGRPSKGPTNAPVTVVVFSDFQCPYCKGFGETLKRIASEEKRVRFIFRNLPLEMHPWAKSAAEIAACVQAQSGDGFWQVHDYLFEHQSEFNLENVRGRVMGFAVSLRGLSGRQLGECVDKHLSLPQVQRDVALAAANKVGGTPTIFVNGQAATGGAPTREYLLTLIRENLREVDSGGRRSARVTGSGPGSHPGTN